MDGVSDNLSRNAGELLPVAEVDREGGQRTSVGFTSAKEIVVEATSPGLTSASTSIPVSSDVALHGVLNVAARSTAVANAWNSERTDGFAAGWAVPSVEYI